MKKILILTVLISMLVFTVSLAWTGDIYSNGLQGFTLSEPASLLLMGAALFSFSLYWKRVARDNAKAADV